MELNYNKDLLKSLLNMTRKHDEGCSELKANSIIIFNSKFYKEKQIEIEVTDPIYTELSSGEFKIQAKDKNIIKNFEDIQDIIISRRGS